MRRRYRKSLRVKRKKPIYKNGVFWITIFFFLVSGGIFYLLFLSPFFQIREIKISGAASSNEKVSSEQILSQVQAKIEQKLLFFTTRSIILVNLKQIKKEILEKFPQIAEVYFKIKFPAILELEIEERKPFAIFNFEENYFFIDPNANPAFGPLEAGEAFGNLLHIYNIPFEQAVEKIIFNSLNRQKNSRT